MVKMFKSLNLQSVKHGFFGRIGGVSTGIYSSLNLSENTTDSKANIYANKALVLDALDISSRKVFFPNQKHTNSVVFIDKKADFDKLSHQPVDAVITNLKGVGIGILTADCSPILAHESESGFILAIHAGWKGALAGVCENALNSLKDLGVDIKKISVAIGPTISNKSYEVKLDFVESFIKTDPYFEKFFIKEDGNYFFDLTLFIESRFNQFGVYDINNLGLCTYENPELFFSNRRAYHKSERDFGRMASIICL
jgi:YfiH family protein